MMLNCSELPSFLLQSLDEITLQTEPECLGKLFVMALVDETGLIMIATRPGKGQGRGVAQRYNSWTGLSKPKVLQ